jgi:predicted MFS family arabinose efflux permease
VSQRFKLSYLLLLSKNMRFVSLSLFGALPVKFALTGFIFYFIPLYLEDLKNTQSEIGRVLMLYGLVAIFITPFAAKLADRFNAKRLFTVLAGFLSGISILLVTTPSNDILYAALAVGLLGAAHAIGISPQLALIPEICAKETQIIGKATVISLFRLIERIGAVAGSLVMATLFAWGEAKQAAFIVGLGLIICALLLSLTFLLDHWREKRKVLL